MIMVCDMIGSYALLPPLMIVSIISVTLSSRWSIYRGQVLNRFKSPAHFWDMNFESLENMPIEKSFHSYRNIALVHNSILLANLESLSVRVQASDFVVTDENGHYEGMISLRKVRLLDEYSHIRNLITVGDSTDGSVPCLTPHDSLGQALRIISEREIDKVAIVDDEKKVMGYLRYIDIMSAYRTGMRKTE
jgi:CIC family chloride channel protein